MLSADNFVAVTNLKQQIRKWRTVSFLLLFFVVIFAFKPQFGGKFNIDNSSDYIANIVIEGMITDDDYRTKILKEIAEQKNIKAVIVNVNSPGGDMVGSEILYENLRLISKNKPTVALMSSVAASGGYMASIASDYIIARNGTVTGSIGVILQAGEITELAKKIGIKFTSYKSSDFKAAPSPFEKSNPQINRVINESIKDSYEFFTELVLERRKNKLNKKELAKIFDGRIFTGRQALKNGLIDEIGGKDEALVYLKKSIGIDKSKEIELRDIQIIDYKSGLFENFFGKETMSKFFGFTPNTKKMNLI